MKDFLILINQHSHGSLYDSRIKIKFLNKQLYIFHLIFKQVHSCGKSIAFNIEMSINNSPKSQIVKNEPILMN